MTISNEHKSYLRYLTYAAQFSHPMKGNLEKVFQTLIYPKLPFESTATYLHQIVSLLQISDSFENIVPSTVGHNDNDIRDFLRSLADEIERRHRNALRSGKPASESGAWKLYGMPDHYVTVEEGEALPYVAGSCAVWECAVPCTRLDAREAITSEFAKFYEKSVLYGAPSRKPAQQYFIASANRMANILEEKEYLSAISLLRNMAVNLNHEMIQTLETVTKVNWTSNETNRKWLVEVLNGLAMILEIKQESLRSMR